MSIKHLSQEQNLRGTKVDTYYDEDGDKLIKKHSFDLAPTLDHNRAYQNSFSGYTPSKEMKHVASIPPEVLYLWEDEMGKERGYLLTPEGWTDLKRKLNDPDNKFLRTGLGRI